MRMRPATAPRGQAFVLRGWIVIASPARVNIRVCPRKGTNDSAELRAAWLVRRRTSGTESRWTSRLARWLAVAAGVRRSFRVVSVRLERSALFRRQHLFHPPRTGPDRGPQVEHGIEQRHSVPAAARCRGAAARPRCRRRRETLRAAGSARLAPSSGVRFTRAASDFKRASAIHAAATGIPQLSLAGQVRKFGLLLWRQQRIQLRDELLLDRPRLGQQIDDRIEGDVAEGSGRGFCAHQSLDYQDSELSRLGIRQPQLRPDLLGGFDQHRSDNRFRRQCLSLDPGREDEQGRQRDSANRLQYYPPPCAARLTDDSGMK